MTITVTYMSGTVETYTSCSSYTNDGKVVKFVGKLSGESVSATWEINWSSIKKIRLEA